MWVWVDIGYVDECGSRWMWVSVGPLVCGSNSVGDTQESGHYASVDNVWTVGGPPLGYLQYTR
jgi:hypothetical protein